MRTVRSLYLCAALIALLPVPAHAQSVPVFEQPFQYNDPDGAGTMTITPLNPSSTGTTNQPISVLLTQGNRRFTGSGVYSSFSEGNVNLVPATLVAFALVDVAGQSYFFQARIASVNGFTGEGTYWPLNSPQNTRNWRITSSGGTGTTPILNSTPDLREGWSRISFNEAIGGLYFSTFNTERGPVSTATWAGNLTQDGTYRVEVFIPRQPSASSAPRTNRATYTVFEAGVSGQQIKRLDQAVAQSSWVDLGTFFLRNEYRIQLSDETGELARTRSVVANAVRVTRVQ